MKNKIKEFNINENDKNNLIYYLDNSTYNPEPELIINLLLEYQFNINNNKKYIIKENDLQLLVNSIYCMSSELKELRKKK
jgi:hypothetical protein